MTIKQIEKRINDAWNTRNIVISVCEFEDTLVAIMRVSCDEYTRNALLRECIDAYTKRGHFIDDTYYSDIVKG